MYKLLIGFVCFSAATGIAHAFLLGDAENGEQLHRKNCQGCHAQRFGDDGSEIYTRPNHSVKTIEGLMGQVEFCNKQISLGLKDDDINDLVLYLNDNFYKFE